MESTIFSSHLSILVNHSPTKDFIASRGFILGDPLSPFLFHLATKDLVDLMRNAYDFWSFKGFHFNKHTHFEMLQFVDDTVFICDGLRPNFWCIKVMLRDFELASGFCINLNKIKLYGVHLDGNFVQPALTFLTCEIGNLPFMFLGIPMGVFIFQSWEKYFLHDVTSIYLWVGKFLFWIRCSTIFLFTCFLLSKLWNAL